MVAMKRPAAAMASAEDAPEGSVSVASEAMCCWPAHEIRSFSIMGIWLCMSFVLIYGYTAFAFLCVRSLETTCLEKWNPMSLESDRL